MKYMLLIHHGETPTPGSPEWEAISDEEKGRIYADYQALNETPGLTPGVRMGEPGDATTVRVADGQALTTDGPYAETKEALGGYCFLEAEDLDAAIAVAAGIPAARLGGGVEVRPVTEG